MSGIVHLAVGVMVGKAVGMNVALSALGSLLPDTDHRRSILGRWIPMWLFFKHRGFMHSIPALIIAYLIHPALGLGYATHLLLDRLKIYI